MIMSDLPLCFLLPCQYCEASDIIACIQAFLLVHVQAIVMYDSLKDKKVTTALVMFKGEQHGFRTSNAIRRALDGQYYFFGKVLGIPNTKMPDDLEDIPIANL